ncbi:hypothetical protein Ami103574_03145 [Aminipila butyrica]|uniref:Flagellar assembly protein FliH/Type III secretion system HrpE domain-containing protein n=1 Tax=Aminipila butyrica TaxID=433296 RepID=A0A858BR48_9FIRM|nr:FliH/SctL family protein [Aminipila butyrica]QIB68371.1 hypothetical protein Ami103574_03145 [Aminipila butyrica]
MRSLRKSYETLQLQSSLEMAEKRLEEAIEGLKKESKYQNARERELQRAVEDAMSEVKKVVLRDKQDDEAEEVKGIKPLYGFGPEFSGRSKIENTLKDIDEEQKNLVASILGEQAVEEAELAAERAKAEDFYEGLLSEEFHDGYEALDRIAKWNQGINAKRTQSPEEQILSESEEYEMKAFNEKNVFDDETYQYEADDIMPTNFYLSSFDEEESEAIQPYDINEALVLGEVIPPPHVEEELSDLPEQELRLAAAEEVNPPAEADNELSLLDEAKLEEERAAILAEARQQAEELLEEAFRDREKILIDAQAEADRILQETVQKAEEEAAEKGYAAGYEKGNNEGFMAAENAVNEAMIQEAAEFRKELAEAIEDFNTQKDRLLQENLVDLTDLAVNVAEKVIKITLKSSKDVVTKMIVAAAEDCRDKQWAKVYISHEEKVIAMNLEKELIDALNQISSNVKVVVMEAEPSGTCIIESPDQIVDASVNTQMDNIRQLVSDNRN